MSLRGKRILLDPGHGGDETGAVGPGGLKEKDVNLSVARILADMLREAGAEVAMTREGDETVPLEARRKMAEEMGPDALVSIHHNASPEFKENRTEAYYPWVPQGPSFDLAWIMARRVSRALGLPMAFPLPGKYAVLKGELEPKVLIEASYIQDPSEELALRTARRREAEASAILEALEYYFKVPGPRIVGVYPEAGRIRIQVEGEIEPLYSDIRIGDARPPFEVIPHGLVVSVPFLPNGEHELRAVVRNSWGRSSRLVRFPFRVHRPPAAFAVSHFPKIVPYRTKAPILLVIDVLDDYGFPVRDGTEVRLQVLEEGGRELAETLRTQGGKIYYPWTTSTSSARLKLTSGRITRILPLRVNRDSKYAMLFLRVEPGGGEVRVKWRGNTYAALAGKYFWLSAKGGLRGRLGVWAPGYRATSVEVNLAQGDSRELVLSLSPLEGGLLHGRRFYLDIGDPRMIPVALELANTLRFHGALVKLSQETQVSWTSEAQSAWEAVEFGSEVLISFDVRDERTIKYYHRDPRGAALAELLRHTLGEVADFKVAQSGSYILIHPDGARVAIHMPVDGTFKGVADAIFKAILNYAVVEFAR